MPNQSTMSNSVVAHDGVGHINVYSKGRTILGRFLSNFEKVEIDHKDYGKFLSIEGFWYWITTGRCHDTLRSVWGTEAKKLGEQLQLKPYHLSDADKEDILEITRIKIRTRKDMWPLIVSSYPLPFVHYYVYKDKVYDKTQEYSWVLDELSRIRFKLMEKFGNGR